MPTQNICIRPLPVREVVISGVAPVFPKKYSTVPILILRSPNRMPLFALTGTLFLSNCFSEVSKPLLSFTDVRNFETGTKKPKL